MVVTQFPSHSSLQSETVAYANSFSPSPLKSPSIFTSEVCENKKLTIRKKEIEAIFFIIICVLCISKIKKSFMLMKDFKIYSHSIVAGGLLEIS